MLWIKYALAHIDWNDKLGGIAVSLAAIVGWVDLDAASKLLGMAIATAVAYYTVREKRLSYKKMKIEMDERESEKKKEE